MKGVYYIGLYTVHCTNCELKPIYNTPHYNVARIVSQHVGLYAKLMARACIPTAFLMSGAIDAGRCVFWRTRGVNLFF